MESFLEFPQAVSLVYDLEKLSQAKILATSDNPEEFIEKRQRLYHAYIPELHYLHMKL